MGVAGLWAFCQATAHPVARHVRPWFLLFALIGAFLFTFPTLRPSAPASSQSGWIGVLALSAAFYAGGIVRLARASRLPSPASSVLLMTAPISRGGICAHGISQRRS